MRRETTQRFGSVGKKTYKAFEKDCKCKFVMHDTYNLFGNFRLEYKTCGDKTGNCGDGLNDSLTMMVWRENKKWIWTHGDHQSLVSLTLKPSRTNHWKSLKYQC